MTTYRSKPPSRRVMPRFWWLVFVSVWEITLAVFLGCTGGGGSVWIPCAILAAYASVEGACWKRRPERFIRRLPPTPEAMRRFDADIDIALSFSKPSAVDAPVRRRDELAVRRDRNKP